MCLPIIEYFDYKFWLIISHGSFFEIYNNYKLWRYIILKKLFVTISLLLIVAIVFYVIFKPNQIEKSMTYNSNEKSGDCLILVNKSNILPNDYIPKNLIIPNVKFASCASNEEKMMQGEAAKALEELFTSASKEKITLYGLSAYRSYKAQKQVYDKRVKTVGKKQADKYVAHSGASEHQTGLAIDVTNGDGAKDKLKVDFGQTKEGKWLKSNAQNFGFIMRYPMEKENITGYSYESWHIRYVGVDVAKKIYNKHMVLEEYLKNK